jgi:hypothetical protein
MDGAFTVYSFSEPADPDVVYFEHTSFERVTNDHYVESPEIVERYRLAFEGLAAAALSPDESSLFLSRLIGEL